MSIKPFVDHTENLIEHALFGEVDLAWIAKTVKEDLDDLDSVRVLCIIDDFIESKKAEVLTTIRLAAQFKELLLDNSSIEKIKRDS